MGGGGDDTARTPRRLGLLALALVGVVAVSVLAVVVLGGAIGSRLEDDDPTSVTVRVTGAETTSTTAPEAVVLAPPVSIDRSTSTAPGG